MNPTHIHADAITVLIGGAIFLFWSALLKSAAIAWIAKSPDSAYAQALSFIV